MKNLLLSGIVFLLGSTAGVRAEEYWIPGTAEGAKVEFVTLEFGAQVRKNTGGKTDSRIELGLEGHGLVFCLDFNQSGQEADRSLALYQSLMDARNTSVSLNILVEEGTLLIKGVRFGITEHPLALDGSKPQAGRDMQAAGKVRFDLLGRSVVSAPSRPKADAKAPIRAIVAR